MIIEQNIMNKLHIVQIDMLKSLIEILNKLHIEYFFVHGSLLGACQSHDFIPEDDDIDIAIFRNDYERLLKEGNEFLPKTLFIQSTLNDNYPLPFAKLRKNDTAFIQPFLEKYNCNQGIYIDIFPIDYSNDSFLFKFKLKMMNIRINSDMCVQKSFLYKLIEFVSKILYPSINKTMIKRERLLKNLKKNNNVSIYGGKKLERNMPLLWFSKSVDMMFCGLNVSCPLEYSKYLEKIYGNGFLQHNPANCRSNDKGIEISASILDFDNSYIKYQK